MFWLKGSPQTVKPFYFQIYFLQYIMRSEISGDITMKKLLIISVSALLFLIVTVYSAFADLDGFLFELNYRARADMPRYRSALSEQFNIPTHKAEQLLQSVVEPGDAFMCLQLSVMTGLYYERVVGTYKANRGKGWGVIAKELGIKPGSPAFHALKEGDFVFWGIDGKQTSGKPGKGKNQGKGKAKGKEKNY